MISQYPRENIVIVGQAHSVGIIYHIYTVRIYCSYIW